ncbi:MAG: hypothetical protein PHT34_03050 [Oscillospiraceae bacterium]|nr:hypothetical protein [Oscillospiraceae bacterium]
MDEHDSAISEMPIGFGMELAKNLNALRRFSELPKSQQKSLVEGARQVNSKEDMRSYVGQIEQK